MTLLFVDIWSQEQCCCQLPHFSALLRPPAEVTKHLLLFILQLSGLLVFSHVCTLTNSFCICICSASPACLGAVELVWWHTEVKVQPTWTTISATIKIIIKWYLIFLFIKYMYRTDTYTVWFYPEPFISYTIITVFPGERILRLCEAPPTWSSAYMKLLWYLKLINVKGHQRCLIGMLPRPKRL